MDDTEEKLLTSSMSPVSWDACGDGLRGLYNQSEAVTLKEKLHFCLIKFCFHCSCCLHTPSFSPHSWQLVSFKLQISCPWTQVEPQTLMLKSCSSLTRRRSLTPKCTKKHWTLSSMRHLFSRWVLFLHAAVKKKKHKSYLSKLFFFFKYHKSLSQLFVYETDSMSGLSGSVCVPTGLWSLHAALRCS